MISVRIASLVILDGFPNSMKNGNFSFVVKKLPCKCAVPAVVLLAVVLLASCSGKTQSAGRKIDDGLLPVKDRPPLRAISAAPAITEIIAGLGLAERLIAVDKYSRDVEGVNADLPEIDFFYPDIEAIAALNPDIIISGEINAAGRQDTPYEYFKRMGTRVLILPTSSSIEDIYRDINSIADALGVKERGDELARSMRTQIETITAAARTANSGLSAAGKKSVYFEIAPAPHMVSFGRGTYLHEMIEIIGAQNIFAGENRWIAPGAEAVIRANPDIIFFLAENSAATAAEIKNRPGFHTIAAVQQNRVYAINTNSASRPSQNIVLALEEMYKKL